MVKKGRDSRAVLSKTLRLLTFSFTKRIFLSFSSLIFLVCRKAMITSGRIRGNTMAVSFDRSDRIKKRIETVYLIHPFFLFSRQEIKSRRLQSIKNAYNGSVLPEA